MDLLQGCCLVCLVGLQAIVSEVCTGGRVKERREMAVLLGGLEGLLKVPESFKDRRRFLTLGSDVVCISV